LRIRGWLHFYFQRSEKVRRSKVTDLDHEPFGTTRRMECLRPRFSPRCTGDSVESGIPGGRDRGRSGWSAFLAVKNELRLRFCGPVLTVEGWAMGKAKPDKTKKIEVNSTRQVVI
jgi:hypothetical protein